MARRLLDAGFDAKDVEVIEPAPKKGNLVARFRSNGAQKPILLLAHIDVVKAKKEDWSDGRDPFKLTEKDGYYYGRGTLDDKAMWRWRLSSARPRRRARHRPVLKAGLVSRATRRSGVRPAPLFESAPYCARRRGRLCSRYRSLAMYRVHRTPPAPRNPPGCRARAECKLITTRPRTALHARLTSLN